MIIGVDFDNTIVCYDGIFHSVAFERGLVPADLPNDKTSVRNHLRQTGREAAWTELQGLVYGPRLAEAQPYPGVLEFFRSAVRAGVQVRIISHKTRRPFLGEPHDLHAAAWGWLEHSGVLGSDAASVNRKHVFLEETMEAKFLRIQTEGCTHFIDDLPEFLGDSRFPKNVMPILFDPSPTPSGDSFFLRMRSWSELDSLFLSSRPAAAVVRLAQSVLRSVEMEVHGVKGGANNRVYRFKSESGEVFVKAYHESGPDGHDRFTAEENFYKLIHATDMPSTPLPMGWDHENRLCALSAVSGRKLEQEEVSDADVSQCLEWLVKLQSLRRHPLAQKVRPAADACFSIADHLSLVQRRVNRLVAAAASTVHEDFATFVQEALLPHVTRLSSQISNSFGSTAEKSLSSEHRVLSPSDFGFHNAIRNAEGKLSFLDFEYAGWDDPAKLLCDFFCQPQIAVPMAYAPRFVGAFEDALGECMLGQRFNRLLPLHAAKWSCILLNEFILKEASRRVFAGTKLSVLEMQSIQLEKARRMLAVSQSLCSSVSPL